MYYILIKQKQISELYKDASLKANARKLCNNRFIWEDLYQETFLYLYSLEDEKFNRINNLKAFTFSVMFGKANSQSRSFCLNGKDNVLFEMCNSFKSTENVNQIDNNYNYQLDTDFENVFNFLNTNKNIKESDVYILFENVSGKKLTEISKELDINYRLVKRNKARIIKQIKTNVKL